MTLNRRTVQSIGWRSGANIFRVVILFVRFVALGRLLPIELFGIYAGANAIRGLTGVLAGFGLDGALIHRSKFSDNEELAARTHFTLKLLLYSTWLGLLVVFALIFLTGLDQLALIVVATTTFVNSTTGTARVLLRRRVAHRRLSLMNIVTDIGTTATAVSIAYFAPSIWALLVTDIVSVTVAVFMLYVWRPVWRPHLALPKEGVAYYFEFGRKLVTAQFLLRALDQLDDLWTKIMLGDHFLGLYSRAYTFALYPRKLVAMPVDAVALGSYAALKGDRLALSKMFFRINALLVRSGFLFAGLLALVAPEAIRLTIGAKWLPFLTAFRLMLIFTLLDPIKVTVGDLFVALGQPKTIVRARFIQLLILLAGLFVLGLRYGIEGVALAVDAMLIVGIGLLMWEARKVIDFSITKLFAVPTAALVLGLVGGRLAIMLPYVLGSDFRTGAVKATVFGVIYLPILLIFERKQNRQLWHALKSKTN